MQAFIHDFKKCFNRLCSVAIYLKFAVLKVNNPINFDSAYSPATVRTLGYRVIHHSNTFLSQPLLPIHASGNNLLPETRGGNTQCIGFCDC